MKVRLGAEGAGASEVGRGRGKICDIQSWDESKKVILISLHVKTNAIEDFESLNTTTT